LSLAGNSCLASLHGFHTSMLNKLTSKITGNKRRKDNDKI
jgi:hypothetical protein